jgi:hypothetical protein
VLFQVQSQCDFHSPNVDERLENLEESLENLKDRMTRSQNIRFSRRGHRQVKKKRNSDESGSIGIWRWSHCLHRNLWLVVVLACLLQPCFGAASEWRIDSGGGYCQVDGACVTDGAGNYGNNEACEFTLTGQH